MHRPHPGARKTQRVLKFAFTDVCCATGTCRLPTIARTQGSSYLESYDRASLRRACNVMSTGRYRNKSLNITPETT